MPATIKETTSSAKQPGAAKHRPMAPAQMAADTEEALDLLREAARRVAKTTDLSQRIADAWETEERLARGEEPPPSDLTFLEPLKARRGG